MSTWSEVRSAARNDWSLVGLRAARLWRGPGRERDLVVQVAKAAGAGLLAWWIAGLWWQAPMALLAPWTAVLLVQATVYSSITKAVQQLVVITVATLLASVTLTLLDSTLGAMAVVLPVTLLLSSWHRFGDQGMYGPTTALFVLCYGAVSAPMVGHRLLESLLGAAIGIGVNALIRPPVYLRNSREGVRSFGTEVRDVLHQVADGVSAPWDRDLRSYWHTRAERLPQRLEWVREAMNSRRESLRLNPSGSSRSPVQPPQVQRMWRLPRDTEVLGTLAEISEYVRGIARTLNDATDRDTRQLGGVPEVVDAYAELLREIGSGCDTYTRLVTGDHDADREQLRGSVTEAQRLHDVLRGKLTDLPQDPGATAVFGALLMDGQHLIDRVGDSVPSRV